MSIEWAVGDVPIKSMRELNEVRARAGIRYPTYPRLEFCDGCADGTLRSKALGSVTIFNEQVRA